jgi:hypothetical protein
VFPMFIFAFVWQVLSSLYSKIMGTENQEQKDREDIKEEQEDEDPSRNENKIKDD